jgi:hypothetical protein
VFTYYAAGYCRRLTVALWALWFQLLVAGVSPSLPSLSPCESRLVLLMAVSVRVWAWRFLSETVYASSPSGPLSLGLSHVRCSFVKKLLVFICRDRRVRTDCS